jgi:hypothetical protein
MNRSRFDTLTGTMILTAVLSIGGLISAMVPSPYRETAGVIDPIMDRLPVQAVREEGNEEPTVTLTGVEVWHRSARSHYIN